MIAEIKQIDVERIAAEREAANLFSFMLTSMLLFLVAGMFVAWVIRTKVQPWLERLHQGGHLTKLKSGGFIWMRITRGRG